jgi:hypothetical protein
MKNSLKVYYIALIAVIAVQAISTVYQLGGAIGHGEKITALQTEYASLEKELSLIQEQKYTTHSLTALAIQENDSYYPIGKPFTLVENGTLASR